MSKKCFRFFAVLLLAATILTYANHFNNSFHFDDFHTIVNNPHIRSIKNIPLFFKDSTTSSVLPTNMTYRPVVTATLAIDYWLGKGLVRFFFHLSTFLVFLLQGMLMYFFYAKVYATVREYKERDLARITALLAAGWYLLHPANAETVNYIIARSDVLSTFFVLAALILFIFVPFCRKWHLYLLPLSLGILAKPIAAVFPMLLFLYALLFEEESALTAIFNKTGLSALRSAVKKSGPAFLFTLALLLIIGKTLPPTWTPGGASFFHYSITQPYVILHYFATFFLPLGLSADTDLTPFRSMLDIRFLAGSAFVIALAGFAVITSGFAKLRPVSYGILWFFITLLPTSLTPLAEVMNDHRIFFPFIGLMMSVCWAIALVLVKIRNAVSTTRRCDYMTVACILLTLAAYAQGTYRRNIVWRTEESLWRDVTEKSPKNGRGLMNYGLALMAKGDYDGAETFYARALEFTPTYAFLHINIGILKENTGKPQEAEEHFKKAISYQSYFPDCYLYYGRFLKNRKRYDEAVRNLQQALELMPVYLDARHLLMGIYLERGDMGKLAEMAEQTLRLAPNDKQSTAYLESIRKSLPQAEIAASVKTPYGAPGGR